MRKLAATAALALAALLATAAPALAAPELDVSLSLVPEQGIAIGTAGQYKVAVSNVGDEATSAPVEVEFNVPAGFAVTDVTDETKQDTVGGPYAWACTTAPDSRSVDCSGPEDEGPLAIEPGEEACEGGELDLFEALDTCRIAITVAPEAGATVGEVFEVSAEACGGGAAGCASGSLQSEVLPPRAFALTSFDGGAFDEAGNAQTEAGSHPDAASTDFRLSTIVTPAGQPFPSGLLEDTVAELPPGLAGNPQAVPSCPLATFLLEPGNVRSCPEASQVGVLTLFAELSSIPGESETFRYRAPVYNLVAPPGSAALLAFMIESVPLMISAEVRTDGDYGVTARNLGAPPTLLVSGVEVEVWGVPASHTHDAVRAKCILIAGGTLTGESCPSPEADDPQAFFTLPTSCTGPVETRISVSSWEGESDNGSFLSHYTEAEGGEPVGTTDCASLEFDPELKAVPSTNVADSPSGLDFELRVPQPSSHCEVGPPVLCPRATAHLKDTTVTLPEGMAVNPSSANGLGACSTVQAGLRTPIGSKPIHFSGEEADCPDESKIGSVEVVTPLLDHPVEGSVYLASPHDNPFGSLLAIYIAANDAQSGTYATLAGEVHADPNTGQLTTTVSDNPQLPIEEVSLQIDGGARGSLRTPSTCGTYTTTSSLTPWSAAGEGGGQTVSRSDSYEIAQGPSGPCANSSAELPNSPSFDAGTVSPISKRHSPFVLHLRRDDGSQTFSAFDVALPPGLTGKLAGTALCSDGALATAASKSGNEEKASPSCPADSRVGKVIAGAGAGPAPYYAKGTAYLAGPYKGAPVSMAVITPATAGPFDLGTIVIRTPLYVNPVTAQISAKTDPIPTILEGIPLDVRSVDVVMDRPEFTLTGTSCDPDGVKGLLTSTLGQGADLFSRYQLSDCSRLPFKPKISLFLRGKTKRGGHPALTVVLKTRPNDANIAALQLAMPRSEFLENAHIKTICTRVQFAADNCPPGAVYGRAVVRTPLLDYPLAGKVYLRSSDNVLPDLVPDLRGPAWQPVRVESAGKTDSIRGGIRNTFSFIPDAPFTKLVTRLPGGRKGLLVNSRDICKRTYRATVRYRAHNGLTYTARPKLRVRCKGKGKKRGHRKHRRALRIARRGAAG